jgi:urease accessory protein UreE
MGDLTAHIVRHAEARPAADSVTLDHEGRHLRRRRLTTGAEPQQHGFDDVVAHVDEPFEPEGGAFGSHGHAHPHG